MSGLTSQQRAEFAALRRALSEGDYEMVIAEFDILQSLETPLLPLLDALGRGIWDDEDDEEEEGEDLGELLATIIQSLDEEVIPDLAAYLMEEEGPDLLLDMAAERLQEFSEAQLLRSLSKGLRSGDERIREGARDYLDEMAVDSEAAADLLDEIEETE